MEPTIEHNGDTWRVASQGVRKGNKIYCHLYSTTRGTQQKNGFHPIQSCDFVKMSALKRGGVTLNYTMPRLES